MNPSDIWLRVKELEKSRREYQRKVMEDYDKSFQEELKKLQEECLEETGHNFKFSAFGIVGTPHFRCTYCGTLKVEDCECV
jgi:hypothetical protein